MEDSDRQGDGQKGYTRLRLIGHILFVDRPLGEPDYFRESDFKLSSCVTLRRKSLEEVWDENEKIFTYVDFICFSPSLRPV